MKAALTGKPLIHVALVENDPLRFVGFRALFEAELDFELISSSLPEADTQQKIDVVLLSEHSNQKLFDAMSRLKSTHPFAGIVVAGSGMNEETILNIFMSGARGYVDTAASPSDFVRAIRTVSQGSVWAPRRLLSSFIERVSSLPAHHVPAGHTSLTNREQEVLEMLVAGLSNKEIGFPLGIGERTVKAHVSKLMRKIGAQNRIELSVHAIKHSLVSAPKKDKGKR